MLQGRKSRIFTDNISAAHCHRLGGQVAYYSGSAPAALITKKAPEKAHHTFQVDQTCLYTWHENVMHMCA